MLELHKDNTKGHAKVDEESPMRPQQYRTEYRKPRKTGARKGGGPQGRPHQLFVQCQKVSLEKTYASNIIQTKASLVYRVRKSGQQLGTFQESAQ